MRRNFVENLVYLKLLLFLFVHFLVYILCLIGICYTFSFMSHTLHYMIYALQKFVQFILDNFDQRRIYKILCLRNAHFVSPPRLASLVPGTGQKMLLGPK